MLLDALNEHTVDAGAGVDAVASFDNVNVMAPRGRFEVEMYLSFLKLIGQVRAAASCGTSSGTLLCMLCLQGACSCWQAAYPPYTGMTVPGMAARLMLQRWRWSTPVHCDQAYEDPVHKS